MLSYISKLFLWQSCSVFVSFYCVALLTNFYEFLQTHYLNFYFLLVHIYIYFFFFICSWPGNVIYLDVVSMYKNFMSQIIFFLFVILHFIYVWLPSLCCSQKIVRDYWNDGENGATIPEEHVQGTRRLRLGYEPTCALFSVRRMRYQ